MADDADSGDSDFNWYRSPDATSPFLLTRRITFQKHIDSAFRSIAAFPWDNDSVGVIWEGSQELSRDAWNSMVIAYEDAVATATDSCVEIYFVRKNKSQSFTLPPALERDGPLSADVVHLAWVLSPSTPNQPLLLISRLHTIYILNVTKSVLDACLIGHGGAITSVTVHPVHPHIFATTSRDFTTRIYDLRFPPHTEADVQYNPHWPPSTYPSSAGPAFGLNMGTKEGEGMGRCIIVLMGGLMSQTGGHSAAVLGAAFHARKPLIATCGLDRAVKIWALPPTLDCARLIRMDKPIFSSSSLHRARVVSVNWLSEDILQTHSAPAILPTTADDGQPVEFITEPGDLLLWQWLGFKRYFPPHVTTHQQRLRPELSDWMNSGSFRILSRKTIPFPVDPSPFMTPQLHMCTVRVTHCPPPAVIVLLTLPNAVSTRLIHVPHVFEGTSYPKFPSDCENGEVFAGKQAFDTKELASGWSINIEDNITPRLSACAMTPNGNYIVGVGTEGTMWVWTIR